VNEKIAALLEEKRGYENRLRRAENEGHEDLAKALKKRVAAVEDSLRVFGHKASAPAERAERRPAAKSETR
jgi:hypothetical protein